MTCPERTTLAAASPDATCTVQYVRVYCQECGCEIKATKCEPCAREELLVHVPRDSWAEAGE